MPARKNENGLWEVEIDSQKYEFEKWDAEEGTEAIMDFFVIMGQPIGVGVAKILGKDGSEEEGGLNQKMDPNVIGEIVGKLSSQIGANRAIAKGLIVNLASRKVACDGKQVKYAQHFRDRYAHLMKVVKAGAEVQFSSFFDGQSVSDGILRAVSGLTSQGQQT